MEKLHFPGYGRCTACQEIIPEKDFHNHNLNCRPKLSSETKLCQVCNKHIHPKQFEEHLQMHEEQTLSSNTNLSSPSKCPICFKLVQHFPSHCQLCQYDQNNSSEYQTHTQIDKDPLDQTIYSNDKQTNISTLSSEDIDQSDYQNHLDSSSNNQIHQTNNTSNHPTIYSQNKSSTQIDKKHLKEQISLKRKQMLNCSLCNEQIDQSELRDHIKSCSNNDKFSSRQSFENEQLTNDLQKSNNKGERNSSDCPEIDLHLSKKSIIQLKKQMKVCPLCSKDINQLDYQMHLQICSNDSVTTMTIDNEKTNPSRNSIQICSRKSSQIKECPLCSQSFDEQQYIQHLQSCLVDQKHSDHHKSKSNYTSSTRSSTEILKWNNVKSKQTKVRALCSEDIDQSDYSNHLDSCSNDQIYQTNNHSKQMRKSFEKKPSSEIDQNCSKEENSFQRKEKVSCSLCNEQIDQSDLRDHLESCSNNDQSKHNRSISSNKSGEKNSCLLCSHCFDEDEYVQHLQICSSKESKKISHSNSMNDKSKGLIKECIYCFKSIDEDQYLDHIKSCYSKRSLSQSSSQNPSDQNNNSIDHERKDFQLSKDKKSSIKDSSYGNVKRVRDCIICFKSINLNEYEDHVLSCLGQSENLRSNSTTNKDMKCLTCKRSINKESDLYVQISCHSNHNHCLSCLKRSMEQFLLHGLTPICHQSLCDYQLSRHDIYSIPLERHLSDKLLKLVKGQQRPLCPKCHFYIDINENNSFDSHLESCEDLIPCEYCQLPYSFKELEYHTRECRNDQTSNKEKLIEFILIRTKYPFTKEQIRIFIQQQNKNRPNQLDPFSIVEDLAVFGPIFPYDVPTRECGICLESRPYDSIYVFDCDESHKICYSCYYQSCQTKMNNGEMLTCALCTYPLRDGELNQLRIPIEELIKIRDYQMKKSFDIYSSRTRGIIKCPNQNCTWLAEADDPNERFRVQCPICTKTFCSLCNEQYHYRTTCQQLPQITQRWFFWCETERQRYLRTRAKQDAKYENQLADYNRQSNENNNRNKDLRRRYEELMNDEQYKAQNCRLCPSCKRVVQRLEGCDSMICGQDAHGGNIQSGCGAKFNWAQAQPYTPAATQQPQQTILDLPKPDNPVVHHNGLKCDQCQNDVNGIRFDCIHCPALTFCEKCEQEATLIHSRENQVYAQQQHVFKLIMLPEEEANQF